MSVTPRPEFGKPETGQVRYWFRTDAQMRRAYMSPEQREVERQRIGARRAQVKQAREEAKEHLRRVRHGHFTCRECSAGLHDVGIHDGSGGDRPSVVDERICCTCLRAVNVAGQRLTTTKPGPNYSMFRCRVLDPDPPDEDEAEGPF